MKIINVKTENSYNVYIGRGILSKAGEYARVISGAVRAVIISDSNVAPIYAERVERALKKNGFETSLFVFEAGEERKRLSTIEQMYNHFFDNNITRSDIVIALGGGVVGDMAGFAAASYLRGIDFIQIPTSLLAQVDSSVGGKTGVDLPFGKNLVGAFKQPKAVLIDPDTLFTLPKKFFNDGMGEVIKYGCIRSKTLFERLENENAEDFIDDIIYECISIKSNVVENDALDKGERAILNFGHTFGHALEKLFDYSGITHGEAVGLGAYLITDITEKKGITEAGTSKRIYNLLKKYNMTTATEFSVSDILKATRGDKKSSGKGISFIFLKDIGECFIHRIENSDIKEFFKQQ